jgi:DNA-directed RNA polymerase III subunit RPC8
MSPENSLTDAGSEREHDCWVWHYEESVLFFDNQETVRFRVEEEKWFDQQPTRPESDEAEGPGKTSPYKIEASMEDPGLGPCLWWDSEGDEESGMAE